MHYPLIGAGSLLLLIGMVHSVLGEKLIFRRMRKTGIIPTLGAPLLREGHVRIIWATWHLVTVLAGALGAILFRLAVPAEQGQIYAFIEQTILFSILGGSLLVLVATKGKHLGWLGLLGVVVLIWLA